MPLSIPSAFQWMLAACGLFFAFSLHLVPLFEPNPPWLFLWLLWNIEHEHQAAPLGMVVVVCLFLDILLGAPLGWTCVLILPSYGIVCLGLERWPTILGMPSALIAGTTLYYLTDAFWAALYGFNRSLLQTLLFWVATLLILRLFYRPSGPTWSEP